ncbi:receptor-type tyrosine-protein phosphatase F-like, partial [Sycon ciliatum]|uniref:receptor-type tyrosine-protein phosphatase F-like n=1 Tax=Sycon ciliatum TaxID=27933 RepID=UPI0031F6BC98
MWVYLNGERIIISWFAATPNNAPLTSYTIKYGYVNCLGQIMENSTDLPPSTTIRAIDVEPSQNYTLQLRASNAIGAGNYTLPTQILTGDKSPSGSPENVSVQALSPYSANVSWMPIPCMEQNGNISGYDVEYNITVDIDDKRYVDTYHGIQAVRASSELSTIISGLNAFFTYNFRVRGRTVVWYGPYSPSISSRTLTSVAPQYLNTSSGLVVTCIEHQERVILSCSFRAVLKPVITWERENTSASMGGVMTKQITSSSNLTHTGTLTFIRVERTDEDNYTCTATNANGTDAVALYVRVQARPVVRPFMKAQIVRYNEILSMAVIVDFAGDPATPITPQNATWTKAQNHSWSGERLLSPNRLNLTINRSRYSDAGTYTMCLTNVAGSACVNFTIRYIDEIQIMSPTESVRVNQLQSATFSCNASGYPAPIISWYYNGRQLANTKTVSIRSTTFTTDALSRKGSHGISSVLHLRNVTNEHNKGSYTCTATNSDGSNANSTAELKVFVPTVPISPPASINASESGTVQLTCNMYGVPQPSVEWYKDGKIAKVSERHILVDNNRTLIIANLEYSDRGDFHCFADNRDTSNPALGGYSIGQPTTVDVYVAPQIVTSPRNVTLTQHTLSSFSLHCVSFGNPRPNMYWLHKGLPASRKPTIREVASANATFPALYDTSIELRRVSFWERGTYTCVSEVNGAGFVNASQLSGTVQASATLTVNTYPTFLQATSPSKVVFPNQINVTCSYSGYPLPIITFQAPGLIDEQVHAMTTSIIGFLPDGLPYRRSTLIVKRSRLIDSGRYACVGMNPVGTAIDTVPVLLVLGVPDAPSLPVLKQNVPNMVTIAWSRPDDNNAAIANYTI